MDGESIFQIPIDKDVVLGVWNCSMTNVSSPYEHGVFFITKQGETYDVVVQFSNGMLSGQDVIVEEEHIKFNLNIAGLERVSFVMLVKGNRIIGESYSMKNSSQISGVRQLPVR